MKKNIIIFHFLPVELYPPVLNILDYFSDNNNGRFLLTLITTNPNNDLQLLKNKNINIVRLKGIDSKTSSIIRIFRYFNIYISVLFHLLKQKPKAVFYFETLSSLPCLIYKRFYKRAHIYIHYHELVTLSELKKGRRLNNLLNKLEQRFYKKASWISETNIDRLRIFTEENNLNAESGRLKILPNYPPKKWIKNRITDIGVNDKIRLLHIGALSLESMYIDQCLDGFGNNNKFEIHFYSHTANQKIIDKLNSYNNIVFKGGLNYNDIPKLKGLYDVGLVLYKGDSLNVKYCAPNKIFEYLALDLDVWCSKELVTAGEYKNTTSYPKMLMVDFENLASFNVDKAISKDALDYKISPYFCDTVYKHLLEQIYEDLNT